MIQTKSMFAVRGDSLSETLQDPALHGRLAQAGVRRIQVNVDDEPVAPALRISTGEPITGILSVWGEPDSDSVGVLTETGLDFDGWLVEERRPIDPPQTADGVRADALANVALVRRPDHLTHDQWLHRWLVDHAPIAIETQATFGYVQNVVIRPLTEQGPRVDAIVEELFPSAAIHDIHAFYGSGGDNDELTRRMTRLMESVENIGADQGINLVPSGRYLYDLIDR